MSPNLFILNVVRKFTDFNALFKKLRKFEYKVLSMLVLERCSRILNRGGQQGASVVKAKSNYACLYCS